MPETSFKQLLDDQDKTPGAGIIERAFIRREKRRQPCHWCGTMVLPESHNYVHVGGVDQDVVACDLYLKGEDCTK